MNPAPVDPLTLTWSDRPEPLPAAAVTAGGLAATALAVGVERRLAAAGPDTSLRVAGTGDRLLVLGDEDELPWADGAVYLGREAGLLVPTVVRPHPGAAFLAAAMPPAPLRVVLPGWLLLTDVPLRAPAPGSLALP